MANGNGNGTVRGRPAETTGVAGSIALLIAHAFGVNDPDVLVSLAVVIGALPALVTAAIALFRFGGKK